MNKNAMLDQLIQEEMTNHQEELAVFYFLKFNKDLVLTGSQFFGTQHEDSDYDFFINEGSFGLEMHTMLVDSLGFSSIWSDRYSSDPTVRSVYEYVGGINVHIQVIKSYWFDRKIQAQSKIQELLAMMPESIRRLTKEEMKDLWRRTMFNH